jgi:hypothetical protein
LELDENGRYVITHFLFIKCPKRHTA